MLVRYSITRVSDNSRGFYHAWLNGLSYRPSVLLMTRFCPYFLVCGPWSWARRLTPLFLVFLWFIRNPRFATQFSLVTSELCLTGSVWVLCWQAWCTPTSSTGKWFGTGLIPAISCLYHRLYFAVRYGSCLFLWRNSLHRCFYFLFLLWVSNHAISWRILTLLNCSWIYVVNLTFIFVRILFWSTWGF